MSLGRVLVVGAHYDDEVLGAGGVMTTHDSAALILCDPHTKGFPEPERQHLNMKAVDAIRAMGIRYFHGGQEDEQLRLDRAIGIIETAIEEWQPDTVIGHWRGDMNQDHQVAAQATLIASRPSRRSVTRVLAMEIMSSTNYGHESIGDQGMFVSIPWPVKEQMLSYYAHHLPEDRSPALLHAQARVRGLSVGVPTAEFFRVLVDVQQTFFS